MNLSRSFLICAVVACFFVFGFSALPVSAAVINHSDPVNIGTDTVWNAGDVHILTGEYCGLNIGYGAILTLEPGAVVKLDKNCAIYIVGKFLARGTSEKPIVITSVKDDKYGGDTNGDGAATVPTSGDWYMIKVPVPYNESEQVDGEVIFDYAMISYGGRIQDQDFLTIGVGQSSNFSITNSELFNNINPISFSPQAEHFSMTHSNIYAPDYCKPIDDPETGVSGTICGGWIWSQSPASFDVSNNYWGSADGPTVQTAGGGIKLAGVMVAGNLNYEPFSAVKFDLFKPAVAKQHPVIVIPGILGSWPDTKTNKLVLDPISHSYDDLIYSLIAAGYTTGTNLFAFPYEWRRSNIITAQLLKQKISEVKAACVSSDLFDCTKVDLIAHSMGGLVARQYIAFDDYAGDVDQLIFIATPHKGAPKAYSMWEGGYLGDRVADKLLKSILKNESKKVTGSSGDIGLVTYLQNYHIDSVKELLPIYSYIYDEILGQVRYYPNNYPTNSFLENLNSVENLNKLKAAVKITNIIGSNGDKTIMGYGVESSTAPLPMWTNGIPRDFNGSKSGIILGSGDGTVPAISNNNLLNLTPIVINQDHNESVSYAQSEVIKELVGSYPEKEIHNFHLFPNILMISLRCPADIQIIAPDGKRLGRDTKSPTTLVEIPDGYYYYSDDSLQPEFAIIPNPQEGEYKVKVVGTDNGGMYTVDTSYFTDATSTESEYFGVILPGQEQSLNFIFSTSSVSKVKAAITIQTAINDVSLIYNRQLLVDNNAKKKIIQQYNLLKLKVEIIDKLNKLALNGIKKLEENTKLKSAVKSKLIELANNELNKLSQKRQEEITSSLNEMEKYLLKILASDVLKQLGYDIIKSNNEYLINNW